MLLVLCLFIVDMKTSYSVESPAIMVVPTNTLDETLTTGKNFTISIYTDYNGSDVWSYQFTLSYNASILHIEPLNKTDTWTGDGTQSTYNTTIKPVIEYSEKVYVNDVLKTRGAQYTIAYDEGRIWFFPYAVPPPESEVKAVYQYNIVNGDLITRDKAPSARFEAGTFNNALGTLSLTLAWFFYSEKPVNITSGPGILANITFTVVGYGTSNITLGSETKLVGWTESGYGEDYDIIDAKYDPDHIQHGYFSNKILGDVNGDGAVDTTDLINFKEAYGSESGDPNWTTYAYCDLNGDGKVDALDLFILSKNYGKSVP